MRDIMEISETPLSGLLVIKPKVFKDERGHFYEMFHQHRYLDHGFPPFVQDNLSYSKKNVLRGLHYQLPQAQGKLVGVTQGEIWDVAVDLRLSSLTFGKWYGICLNDQNHLQLYIPPGFAHGFCVLSDFANFYYKCTEFYTTETEKGIAWNDPQLNIHWPIQTPLLSSKDKQHPFFSELTHDILFT